MQALSVIEAGPLSTSEFCEELTGIDFSKEGPRIRSYKVDLEPITFIGTLSLSTMLIPIESSDGVISNVRENPGANAADNSASSGYFSLHTDGKYLPVVPEMVILHCVDPGNSEIPTVFVDTKDILDVLQDTDRLEEAKLYDLIFRNKDGIDFVRPLMEANPINGEPVMNIAIASPQCHLRPRDEGDKPQGDADKFYELLEEIVEQHTPAVSHAWQNNDVIVFDNLRLIHGRGLPEHKLVETSDAQRHLHRIWLSRSRA